jgi:hypothetical protein
MDRPLGVFLNRVACLYIIQTCFDWVSKNNVRLTSWDTFTEVGVSSNNVRLTIDWAFTSSTNRNINHLALFFGKGAERPTKRKALRVELANTFEQSQT